MSFVIWGSLASLIAILVWQYLHRSKPIDDKEPSMDTAEFRDFIVTEIEQLSHDTKRFRFALPEGESLNLPLGGHVQVQMQIGTEIRKKPYTPITGNNAHGYFDLVIKTYEQGKISKAFHQLSLGDTVSFKALHGRFKYTPCEKNQTPAQQIGMIAGGTGITPMYQVLQAIAENPADFTKVCLLYANRTKEDILLRNELERLSHLPGKDISVVHALSRESGEFDGIKGYITPEVIKDYLPPPGEGVRILVCGPAPFCKAMMEHLTLLNFTPSMIFRF